MLSAMRGCRKLRCPEPAAATVGMRYEDRIISIWDLGPEHDPRYLDLCADHVGRVTPPIGWTVEDLRTMPVPKPVSFPVEEPETLSA